MVKSLITKNLFKVHLLFYVVGFICFITGHFKEFIIFTSIILIHEFGHIIMAFIFKWKFDKIIILPFGGITIFKEQIDKPLYQEFLIAIAGPLSQILFFFLFKQNQIFYNFNLAILFFNLLPIYPLDGNKVLGSLMECLVSYKLSLKILNIVSFINVFFLLYINYLLDLDNFAIVIFLMFKVIFNIKNQKYIFNKFLIERILYKYKQKRIKNVSTINKIYKNKLNFINGINERKILLKKFNK